MAELKEEAASRSNLDASLVLSVELPVCVWMREKRQCVCAVICVLHVSARVLQPSLQFKHSLGCHYGLITVSA